MHIRFAKSITVDGTGYEVGAVVPAAEIPAGCLDSLLWTRAAVECDAPAEPAPEPKVVKPFSPPYEPAVKPAKPKKEK